MRQSRFEPSRGSPNGSGLESGEHEACVPSVHTAGVYPELLEKGFLEQHRRLSISELQSGVLCVWGGVGWFGWECCQRLQVPVHLRTAVGSNESGAGRQGKLGVACAWLRVAAGARALSE